MHINVVFAWWKYITYKCKQTCMRHYNKKNVPHLLFHHTGFLTNKQKTPSHEVPHHRGHVPPVPQFNVALWILFLAPFQKKNSHFCWWCSALPITTLKLGVAGVSKVCISVVSCGWLFFFSPCHIATLRIQEEHHGASTVPSKHRGFPSAEWPCVSSAINCL